MAMALLHDATLRPSKLELLAAWLPSQPWWPGSTTTETDTAGLESIGSYRFDDPADEVGIETYLLRAHDGVVHVPLTYRGSPLPSAAAGLLGTLQHSVLGQRWVYDGCADPVYATALANAIVTGGSQAQLQVLSAGELTVREPLVRVTGSGSPDAHGTPVAPIGTVTWASDHDTTTIGTDALQLVVLRRPDSALGSSDDDTTSAPCLRGVWPGTESPVVLARCRAR